MTVRAKNFFVTILVKYVTIIAEPDLSLQNKILTSQYDICSLF